MNFIARTFAGLEEVLADEIRQIGGKKIKVSKRACLYEGDKSVLYKSNLYLRTALRVLVPFHNFIAFDEGRLYRKIKQLDWSDYFGPDDTFAIDATVNSRVFSHSKYVALKIKDAIVDQFRDNHGRRPNVDTENPTFRLHVHCNDKKFTLSIDTSGNSLHRRGYRATGHPSPLNECLAAGMILLSEWDKESEFIDFMCGSGTLLLEAALIASNTPPNLNRKGFAFEKMKDFDKELFRKIKQDAKSNIKTIKNKIIGSDKSRDIIKVARECIHLAGFDDNVYVSHKSFSDTSGFNKGIIITNPPYGERLKEDDINNFYKMIGDTLKQNYKGYTAWILSGNKDAIKRVGLKPSKKINLFNASIECKFHKYEMYEGSKREPKGKINSDK